jgi:hypothetical protein
MKRATVALLLSLVAVVAVAGEEPAPAPAEGKWIPLFNGKDLDGWVPKIAGYDAGVNFGDTFRVENGVLRVSYDRYEAFGGRFGHLFHRTPFSHYVIAVEYRFTGEQAKGGPDWAFRNSGIMIHGQPVETMRKEQDFPISIEVQLLGGRGDGKPRATANLCTPGTNVVMDGKLETRHCVGSTSKTYDGDQWVRVEVEVHGGGVIAHRVNGETVLSYEKPQIGGGNVSGFDPAVKRDGELLAGGSISLQSESHPVEFRKVELRELPVEAPSAGDAELERAAAWMAGEFDTFAQVARDEAAGTAYRHVRAVLRVVPVTVDGLSGGGRAFYLEQALAESEDKPYRQRVVLLTRLDGRLVNRLYRLKRPEAFVGAWREPKRLEALVPAELELDEGCDLLWTPAWPDRFAGVAGEGGTCRTQLRGATHVVSRVELRADGLTSLDQGFDDAGAHRWGPPPGTAGHAFVRRPSRASTP